LVLKASPVLLAYHASETIGFTSAFALLAPTRFQNHWFSYRFSIVCTHTLPKTLPVPDFSNFLNKKITKPLVLPYVPGRLCKKPHKTIGFTRFSRFLCVLEPYNETIQRDVGRVSFEKLQKSGKSGKTNGFIWFFAKPIWKIL
jgi:hypothetical protein